MDTDYLIERRTLKKRITFWRILAFLVAIGALIGGGLYMGGGTELERHQAHIARLKISGIITGDQATLDTLKNIGESSAKAVFLVIDSPGGTVTGSEALFEAIRNVAAKKPTIAIVDGLAASGGYIAALGADRIIARRTSVIGSIGVLFQYPDVVKLLDSWGVKVESIKSAPLKASPNPVEPTSPEARAAIAAVVESNFNWFKELVKERRNLTNEEVQTVSDGRIFAGEQALPLKLIDEIGSEKQALSWLAKEKGIDETTRVIDWKIKSQDNLFGLTDAMALGARLAGFETLALSIDQAAQAQKKLSLDGVLVLWHPSLDIQ